MPPPDNWAFISKMGEFDGALPESCDAELASWFRRNPGLFHLCDPKREVFRANYTNADVVHVGKPDDGGVDVLLIDTDSQQWLI
jgi:hypothetical protein